MNNTARLFNCTCCRRQTIICTHCDRGNIYCGSICARASRTKNHRIANQIYQKTPRGSRKHAVRQCAYRIRQKIKVTDLGSVSMSQNDLLSATENDTKKITSEQMHCHFCEKNVSPYLRNDYLRYYAQNKKNNLMHLNDTG